MCHDLIFMVNAILVLLELDMQINCKLGSTKIELSTIT
jgi:hypothetical protein